MGGLAEVPEGLFVTVGPGSSLQTHLFEPRDDDADGDGRVWRDSLGPLGDATTPLSVRAPRWTRCRY